MKEFHDLADFELLSAKLFAEQGETRLAAEALARARLAVATGGGEGKRWQLEAQAGELAMRRSDPHSAEQAFLVCLDLALQGQDPSLLARSRFQLGHLYLEQRLFDQAQALFATLRSESTFGQTYRTGLTSLLLTGLTQARQGQHSQAIRQYEICRRVLNRSLGTEPSQETVRQLRQIGSSPESADPISGR